ncbi:DNA-processing protein DprA [Sorangium sp. So ce233]|uniref:DNA-processing protein DprA n=1 Tax=Sorangium sp. So ce233 TaxID=3133290 RepID=UPI003F622750
MTMSWTTPSHDTTTLIELLQRRGIGPAKVREVVRQARQTNSGAMETAAELLPTRDSGVREAARENAARILARCAELGISAIGLTDSAYPSRLRAIPDPPPVLYVRGPVELLSEPSVAVVGTRKASASGLRAAQTIAEFLVRRGVVVVSGLALGIDAAAHTGALAGAGKTVAVLAHGLHMVAPVTNRDIAARLLETGGALVSEHPPDVPPRPAEFVRRNRMQSGMSLASIIVESGVEGGAMHQAQFTVDQGRALLVVLSSAPSSDLREDGARALIERLKARPIRGTAELGAMLPDLLRGSPMRPPQEQPQESLWKP